MPQQLVLELEHLVAQLARAGEQRLVAHAGLALLGLELGEGGLGLGAVAACGGAVAGLDGGSFAGVEGDGGGGGAGGGGGVLLLLVLVLASAGGVEGWACGGGGGVVGLGGRAGGVAGPAAEVVGVGRVEGLRRPAGWGRCRVGCVGHGVSPGLGVGQVWHGLASG